ncbi:MAG: SusC/RagA family TonB-linked outer membrane protein, partial [Prevotella sp.]|nr:SusC/RagA family TonB-linked outer membrane protein [Prevotella sp.]
TGEAGPDIERGDNPAVIATDAAGFDRQKSYYIQNNLTVNINIPWVEGLSIRGNASYDKYFHNRRKFEKPVLLYSWDGINYNSSGLTPSKRYIDSPRLTREHGDQTDWMLNGLINYNRIFNKHTIGFTAGVEAQKKAYERTEAYRENFPSDTKPELSLGSEVGMRNGSTAWEESRLNYFGRLSYNFNERYLVEFVWRLDGSYRFPSNKRYGFFPGVSAAWRASEENWWKNNIRFIEYFKLRASVSQTGNDALDGRSIQYLNTYGFVSQGVVFGGQEHKRLYPVRTPNTSITWEVGTTYNLGFDLNFLGNRLTLETDLFYHKRTNMLISRNASVSQITGLTLPRENLGSMRNQGIEMLVGWHDKVGEVEYLASFNMTHAKDKILFWDETPGVKDYQLSTGRQSRTSLYYIADGIFHTQEEVDAYPHWEGAKPGDIRFKDVDNSGTIDAKDRVRSDKSEEPRFVAGLTLGMKWRNWDLTALFQGATGGQAYIQTWSGTFGNFLKEYYDKRWTPKNPNANGPRTYEGNDQYWVTNLNTYFLRKGDYLRLKNLEIGYTFSAEPLKKAGVSRLRLYTNASNLFTLDYMKVTDPEARSKDLESYPLRRIINFGLQATF